ncbi:hypothetical protein ILYODFUR_027751 [Ilyodon furcidens]|uniref:Uncharacterized protein n=1 Tax=Ilyodon furcidens TaxID=33524 RepID=A0ABV0U139_9TELE
MGLGRGFSCSDGAGTSLCWCRKPSRLHPVSDLQHSLLLDEHVETVDSCINFAAILHTEHACSDSGEEKSLLTGINLQQNQAQCEQPTATADWGFERTEQRQNKKHRSTNPVVLSIAKKNETLMVIAPF